ncbi:MAG: transglutaminaseTgpA domain-containing protein, partial [Microbacterium sp.]
SDAPRVEPGPALRLVRGASPADQAPAERPPARWRILASGVAVTGVWWLVLSGLGSVFTVGGWTLRALSVAATVILTASALRALWRSARVMPVVAGLATGAIACVAWIAPTGRGTLWRTDPGGAIDAVRARLIAGATPLDPGGVLGDALLVTVLVASALSALLLVALRSPVASAVFASLVLLVPAAITGVSVSGTAVLATGALIALSAWVGSPAPSPTGVVAAAAAVAIAAGLVALAPPVRDRVWNDAVLLSPVSESVPDVTIALADDLRERSNARAFTYTTNAAGSYRFSLATLSDFTGGRWLPQSDPDADGLTTADARDPSPLAPAPLGDRDPGRTAAVEVMVDGLVSGWLPLPQGALSVASEPDESSFEPTDWTWTAQADTANAQQTTTHRGDRYTAVFCADCGLRDGTLRTSEIPSSAVGLFPGAQGATEELQPYLDLPDPMPDEISDAARTVAGDATGRIAVGQALQRWFRSGDFAYDESAPYDPGADEDDPYAIMVSLLEDRSGFCVHYASTFAVMARELGAPARVAVGYASRTDGEGATAVRGRELHAWPEIYVDDVGWVAFEPTPGGAGARSESQEGPDAPPDDESTDDGSDTESDEASDPRPDMPAETPDPEESSEATADGGGDGAGASPVGWLLAGIGGVIVIALVPAAVRRGTTLVRRRRTAKGERPAQSAWLEFHDAAVDRGSLRGATEGQLPRARTAEAIVDHLEETGALRAGAVDAARSLAEAMTAERFSAHAPPPDGRDLARALREAIAGLDAGAPRSERVRARLLPRSVLRRRRDRRG